MYKPQVFGKYLLLEKISHGGMGEVYKAKSYGSQGFEKLFAIKRILPKLSKEKSFITMLADEAKIIVSLNHSNIAHVYEFNQIADTYYLAMEFIHGKDLRSIMERVDSIPCEIACYFVAELSKGLHYLHIVRDTHGKKLGIVHRDISPRNIIVSFDGEVKIIDFGIANASNRAFTIGNDIFVGKYAYMSPEQLLRKELTPKSDIFSAGIVLYELLFKKLPPGRMRNRDIVVLDTDESQIDPELDIRLMNTLPKELKNIIEKATAINPEDRYKNALEFHVDLMSFIFTHNKHVNSFSVANYIKTAFSGAMYGREEEERESEAITLSEAVTSFIEQKKVAVLHINIKPIARDTGKNEEVLGMFQEVLRIVLKHGGIIYRLRDTELITVFGLPKNQEDDVYRALLTTLDVKNYVSGLKLNFKVALTQALDFGTVIVNFKDEDLNNFTLSEGPEKQVKDLIAAASPGDILCGPSIERMTKDQFEFTQVERNNHHYTRLIDTAKDLSQFKSSHDHQEHFVNRKTELDSVAHALNEITIDKGKTITIIGEAGIGKTALIREIARRAGESNTQIFIGSFHPYIKTPYSIFRQLIVQLLSDQSNNREISSSHIAELQGYGLTPMEFESMKSILSMRYKSEALDALPPEKKKIIIFLALRKILLGYANQKTICVFEDLHLADELSFEAIDSIFANGPLPNILMIKTHRKEFSYIWKNLDLEEITLHLEPLDKNNLGNYLKTITHIPIEENSLSQIYTKSSGNPLFAGELTKSLLDKNQLTKVGNSLCLRKDRDAYIIPDTIYSLLSARIDSLPKSAKELLRLAAVIGNECTFDTLSVLANKDSKNLKHTLTELQSAGMIQEVSSQNTYTVTHALMRDVVYNNIPTDTRKLLHKKTADYLLEKYTHELEEHTNELAYHYSNSNDGEKAFHYLVKAGDEAHKVYLLNEAHRYYSEAIVCFTNNLTLFGDSYLVLIELHYKVGIINQILGKLDNALTSLNEALKTSQDHQIQDFVPKIYHQIARILNIKGDYSKAFHYIQDAITISSNTNPFDTLEFLHEEANMYRTIHNNTKALEILEKGLNEAKHLDDKQLESKYLNNLGILYGDINYKKAISFFKESYFLRKQMNDKLAISVLFSNVSALWYKNRKFDKAIKYAKLSLRISSEIEDKFGICLNLNNLGEMYLALDDLDRALSYFKQGLTQSREMSWKEGIVASTIHICLINVLKNHNIPETKKILEGSLKGAQELQHPELIAKTYLVQSKILALENKVEESNVVFKNAQDVIKQNNLSKYLQDFERKIH